jgi:hypothetical protein
MAKGTFVPFLDDGDVVTEGHNAAVKAAFPTNPTIGLVFGRIEPLRRPLAIEIRTQVLCQRCTQGSLEWSIWVPLYIAGRMLFDKALLVCSSSVRPWCGVNA